MTTTKSRGYLHKLQAIRELPLPADDNDSLTISVRGRGLVSRDCSILNPGQRTQATDEMFDALISKANQQLKRLLRDVRVESQGALADGRQVLPLTKLLARAVRCAAQQYIVQAELGNLALTDELTGLYNRRGFLVLAARQLKLARRSRRGLLLFFADVDGLKQINDSLGHSEGDQVLRRTAGALKNTFRDSDVIARLAGDEFAVLAIEASNRNEATILARLDRHLNTVNTAEAESKSKLSLSVGVARFDYRTPESIPELMTRADQAMYEQKHTRRRLQTVAAHSRCPC